MELFSHFPRYMKNLTRAWDMVGYLQDEKKLLVTKTFQDSVRQHRGFIDKFPPFLDEIKNPCMER